MRLRYRSNGIAFLFSDVLKTGRAGEAFKKLCAAGCNPDRLAALVMRLHLFANPKARQPAFPLSKKQVRTLNRLDKTLKEIEKWRPFPSTLCAEGERDGLWYRIRDFRECLCAARKMHDRFGSLLTVNARDVHAAYIVQSVREMTSDHKPHYEDVRTLLNAELHVAGHPDFYSNVAAFQKAVTKRHFHLHSSTPA